MVYSRTRERIDRKIHSPILIEAALEKNTELQKCRLYYSDSGGGGGAMSGNNRIHPRDSSVTGSDVEDDDNETHKSEESLLFPADRRPAEEDRDEEDDDQSQKSQSPSYSPPQMMYQQKPLPLPGTYIIQIPKDQIYRLPPPENAHRFKNYTRRQKRRNPCCHCLCWILGIISLLALLSAIAAGIFYFVIRPKPLEFSIEKLSIKGFNSLNLTSSSSGFKLNAPEFNIIVRAENPNKKITVYYKGGSSVTVSHSQVVQLSAGVLPVFYQPPNNVTVFQTALTGKAVRLTKEAVAALREEEKRRNIPLKFDVRVPVRIKVGGIKIWTITMKVHCDISVDKLAANSSIVSNKCGGVKVKLF